MAENFGFQEMQRIQRELQEKYKDKWRPLSPKLGAETVLWAMVEMGEAADIIKKDGDREIMENPEVREHFIEELCDVMMFFNDVMICYGISPEELAEGYRKKHERNMSRW